jgi:dihydroxyacetone kinase-like protein
VSGTEITAGGVAEWVRGFAAAVAEAKDELTALDSAIGDADHGINMDRGMKAVVEKLDADQPGDVPALMKAIGMTLISKVGGAGGPLYGTLFLQFGQAAPPDGMTPDDFAACLDAAVAGVQSRGKAEPGDKTMLDAWLPAVDAYDAALTGGGDLAAALRAAAKAGAAGRDATVDLVARKGRASYLGERSRGHPDPGATSTALILEAAAATLP